MHVVIGLILVIGVILEEDHSYLSESKAETFSDVSTTSQGFCSFNTLYIHFAQVFLLLEISKLKFWT